MVDHVIWESECINIYTEENQPLEIGDIGYCLIFNCIDYYRPILARCIIRNERFDNSLNKEYYVQILEFLETPRVVNKFIKGKQFAVYPFEDDKLRSKKLLILSNNTDYTQICFPVKSFFIRKELDLIKTVREDFGRYMKDDLESMLIETNSYMELK